MRDNELRFPIALLLLALLPGTVQSADDLSATLGYELLHSVRGNRCSLMSVNVDLVNNGAAVVSNVEVVVSALPIILNASTTHGVARIDDDRAISASTGPIGPGESAKITMLRRYGHQVGPPDLTFRASAISGDWAWSDLLPGYSLGSGHGLSMNTDADCDCVADPLVYSSKGGLWSSPMRDGRVLTIQSPLRLNSLTPIQSPGGDLRSYSLTYAVALPGTKYWASIDESGATWNALEERATYLLPSILWGFDHRTGQWQMPYNPSFFGAPGTRFPPGGIPVPGDFIDFADAYGNSGQDPAAYYPNSGVWFIQGLGGNVFATPIQIQFGWSETLPVPGDYDGDGWTDIAVYHPQTGNWYIYGSSAGFSVVNWGFPGAWPVQEDYDADNLWDIAVFYPPTGRWYIYLSSTGSIWTFVWGGPGNEPAHLGYRILKQAGMIK